MILPTEEALERRRLGYRRRGVVCALGFVLIVVSTLLPQVSVDAYDAGSAIHRSLFPAAQFFARAVPTGEGFPAGADKLGLGIGLVTTYLGMAAQHAGVLGGLFTFWVLAAEDVGRWTRRFLLLSGLLLLVSAPTVVLGHQLITNAGVPGRLGLAWAAAMGAGIVLTAGGIAARRRMDSTWFWGKPELIT